MREPSKHLRYTSLGKFRYTLEELPGELQMIYELMLDIDKHVNPDVIHFTLLCLRQMVLYGEALNIAHNKHR